MEDEETKNNYPLTQEIITTDGHRESIKNKIKNFKRLYTLNLKSSIFSIKKMNKATIKLKRILSNKNSNISQIQTPTKIQKRKTDFNLNFKNYIYNNHFGRNNKKQLIINMNPTMSNKDIENKIMLDKNHKSFENNNFEKLCPKKLKTSDYQRLRESLT